jgi:hypothetical protein
MKSILYVLALISSSSAFAFGIDLVGGLNSTTPNASYIGTLTATSSVDSGNGNEYGVLIEIGGGLFGFQTGALFIKREETIALTLSSNTVSIKTSWTALQIPMLVRIHPLPFLAIGVGAAVNMGQGDLSYDQKDPGNLSGGTKTGSESFDAFGQMKNDWVGVASAEIDVPLAPMAHLILRADYQQGLTNVDNSGSFNEKLNTITYMGGLGFAF